MSKIINSIKYEYLEIISCFFLLFWTISPIIEYFLKNTSLYTTYFTFIIYLIGIFGILLYVIYFIKLKKDNKFNIKRFIPELLIIILLIISIISTIFSSNPHLSLYGEGYRKEGLIVYIMYIGILLLASIIKNNKYMKYVLKSIIVSGLFITILPLLKDNFTFLNFVNVFCNTNHYGYYLMINVMLSLFMFIDNKQIIKKIFYLIIYIFFIYILIKNNTFGCYLAISISLFCLLIYSLIKKYQRINVIIVILIFIITSFCVSYFDIKIGERVYFKDTTGLISNNFKSIKEDISGIANNDEKVTNKAGSGRGLLWKEAINYTLEHPIIGGGMENLRNHYYEISKENKVTFNDRPHNIILQVSSFIGIPGAIIYLSLILYVAISNLKIMKNDTIHIMIYFTAMCYFISSMFGNSMYYTSPYFIILLGLLIGFIRRKEKIGLTK